VVSFQEFIKTLLISIDELAGGGPFHIENFVTFAGKRCQANFSLEEIVYHMQKYQLSFALK
jgi:hypothetical protein